MTRGRRQALRVFCVAILPAIVLAVDGWFYVSLKSWTYSLRENGAAVFWPAVLTFGALFFPLAALGFGSDLFRNWSTRGSSRWPVGEGRVTGGKIEMRDERRGKSIISTYQTYRPKVTYSYQVAGATWTNDLPTSDLKCKSREEAEEVLRLYPVGAPVRLRYDPDDPGTAVLQNPDGRTCQSLGLTLFFAAAPFLVAYLIIAWR